MSLSARRYWIFDMDGTLTVAAHDFPAIKRSLGLDPQRPILEQMAALPEREREARFQRLDAIELAIARSSRTQPGALELLSLLHASGARLGILTRNSHANAMETLAQCGLSSFFPAPFVLGREACAPKPSGDGIRKLLQAWDARPEQAVMVGDFLYDLQAGREAGTFTVYFDIGGEGEYAAQADLCVHTFFALRDHLKG
jgi:HAD superfamily hydrolase (TIGR01509 family)